MDSVESKQSAEILLLLSCLHDRDRLITYLKHRSKEGKIQAGKPNGIENLPDHHTRQDWFILGVIAAVVVTGVVSWRL